MNKAQLVEAIADKVGGRQQAAEAVDHVLDAIVRAVVAGERVSVTGFGSFEKVDRPDERVHPVFPPIARPPGQPPAPEQVAYGSRFRPWRPSR